MKKFLVAFLAVAMLFSFRAAASADTIYIGSNGLTYQPTWPDTLAPSANIVTATTTLLVAGVAGQNMYVFFEGFQSGGTNSGTTVVPEYGTGATCGTGTVRFTPSNGVLGPVAIGTIAVLYGGSTAAAASTFGLLPSAVPFIVPNGNNLCGVTAGTTINGFFITQYAIHAN